MPVSVSAPALRFWLSWLAFFGAVVSSLAAGSFIPMFVDEYGRDYPRSLTPDVPAGTAWLLEHLSGFVLACRLVAALGIVAAIVVTRRSESRESSAHSVSLIAAALYYFAVMSFVMFIVLFFVLPHARAGI